MKKEMRRVLALLVALTVMLLSACGGAAGSSENTPEPAPAPAPASSAAPAESEAEPAAEGPSGEIVIATWGGKYNDVLQKYMNEELAKTAPNLTVVYSAGQDVEYRAKALAEKDSETGSFDVMLFDAHGMVLMQENDLIVELDTAKMPNSEFLMEDLRDPYFITTYFTAQTLAYNKEHVTPEPDTWSVMFDPKYKGKVGLNQMALYNNMYAAVYAGGGDPATENWMDYFDQLMLLKENEVKFYASNDALSAAMQSGEIWLAANWRSRNGLLNVEGAEETGNIIPKEGSFYGIYGACIPKNAANPDGAYAFLDAMLSVSVQEGFGIEMGHTPSVTNAALPADTEEKIGFTDDELSRLVSLDQTMIAELILELRPEWEQKFMV